MLEVSTVFFEAQVPPSTRVPETRSVSAAIFLVASSILRFKSARILADCLFHLTPQEKIVGAKPGERGGPKIL